MQMEGVEDQEVVIVGGGICGLATALALHRKGLGYDGGVLVLERSDSLRAAGAGIAILTNGWLALDYLGVASKLRQDSINIRRAVDIDLKNPGNRRFSLVSNGEARNIRRSELLKGLADDLPQGMIRFGCDIVSLKFDPCTSFPVLELSNGTSIRAKVVIGCDGANSVVADFLGLKPTKMFTSCAVRGFTYYENGHGLAPEFVRIREGRVLSGSTPVTDKLAFWFVVTQYPQDSKVCGDAELIKQFALDSIRGFPEERIEMIKHCDLSSLSLTHLRYRAPWEIFLGKFTKGTVTVAGDAMHVMGPFLGQGGSAGIEDAVVLARCLAPKLQLLRSLSPQKLLIHSSENDRKFIADALNEYVKERRMRLAWLSLNTFLFGSVLESSNAIIIFSAAVVLAALFRNRIYHTRFDCGPL